MPLATAIADLVIDAGHLREGPRPLHAECVRRQVERLQDALNEPEIRDEAIQILSGLVERIVIGPQDTGLEVEIVGEIAQMVELGLHGAKNKRAILDDKMACSVKVVAGARSHLYRTRLRYEREARK